MSWLGLDIGGANLKAADAAGFAVSHPFPLWKDPEALPQELSALLCDAPTHDNLAVTITGELADCYSTKREGIAAIVEATIAAADSRRCLFYQTTGDLVSAQEAKQETLLTAASNWHALACLAGRVAPSDFSLLIDIGSTTCDVIPIVDGVPRPQGTNDPERLVNFELVYTGVERSPVCALVDSIPWRKEEYPVAQELFATTRDVYLLLGDLPEDPADSATADGQAATRAAAHTRMARSICADREMFSQSDAETAADAVAAAQLALIAQAVATVIDRHAEPRQIVVSGQGEFLARRVIDYLGLETDIVSLADRFGRTASWCGPAYALAVLCEERVTS